jgi:hypothetical protein
MTLPIKIGYLQMPETISRVAQEQLITISRVAHEQLITIHQVVMIEEDKSIVSQIP